MHDEAVVGQRVFIFCGRFPFGHRNSCGFNHLKKLLRLDPDIETEISGPEFESDSFGTVYDN